MFLIVFPCILEAVVAPKDNRIAFNVPEPVIVRAVLPALASWPPMKLLLIVVLFVVLAVWIAAKTFVPPVKFLVAV